MALQRCYFAAANANPPALVPTATLVRLSLSRIGSLTTARWNSEAMHALSKPNTACVALGACNAQRTCAGARCRAPIVAERTVADHPAYGCDNLRTDLADDL